MFFTDFIEFACRICTFGLNMSDAYLLSLSVNPFRAFFLSCHPERSEGSVSIKWVYSDASLRSA